MKSKFLQHMDILLAESAVEDLTFGKIFEILNKEGHAGLVIFLLLPFLQPIPIPGLSTPLGMMVVFVSFLYLIGRNPYFPKRIQTIHVSTQVLSRIHRVSYRIWEVLGKFLKARLIFLNQFFAFRVINFLLVMVYAFLLALPLPIPFSNTIPTIGILLIALGQLEDDGVFILASYFWLIVVVIFFGGLVAGAMNLFRWI